MNVQLAHDRSRSPPLDRLPGTLRIPDDGGHYPLPPSLGHFPVHRVEDYAARVPEQWRAHGGVFIPMYQREAAWLSFSAPHWRPQALKVAVGMVNAVSGDPWSEAIVPRREQDYLVCPPQPWLDGINAGDGVVRQFVAMPLGMGYTAEGQLTGDERFGGIQLVSFEAKPGVFPEGPAASRAKVRALCAPRRACSGPQHHRRRRDGNRRGRSDGAVHLPGPAWARRVEQREHRTCLRPHRQLDAVRADHGPEGAGHARHGEDVRRTRVPVVRPLQRAPRRCRSVRGARRREVGQGNGRREGLQAPAGRRPGPRA